MIFDNQIAQRIFYLPSAVGKTGEPQERTLGKATKMVADVFKTPTMKRIFTEGHDRQGH